MRIVWLSHFVPYPPTSGALERSFHLLKHAAVHHEVHVLALEQRRLARPDPPLEDRLAALRTICASVTVCDMPFENPAPVRALARGIGSLASFPADTLWFHSRSMHRSAARMAQRSPADLLHVDTIGLTSYTRHFSGVPVVLTHHNLESALARSRARHEGSAWRAFLLRREARKLEGVERVTCPRVAMNLVVSAAEAERLRQTAPGARIQIVVNGVDTRYFTPAPDPGADGGLIFVGTLGWFANRNAARFLMTEILPALGPTRCAPRVMLVGRDPHPGDWGTGAHVIAPGYVPDVRPYLRKACIYVCPVREGGGTRLKVLSALAMAKPLVATAFAVEGLGLESGVHYLRAETAAEFANQIRRLVASADLRRRLGEAGRALVNREYDWSVAGKQLDDAYISAIQRGHHQ